MSELKKWAILELYCGESGKIGFYNSQELGLARALAEKGIETTIVYPVKGLEKEEEQQPEPGITILRIPCRAVGIHAFYHLNFLPERGIEVVHLDSDNQMYAPEVMKFCKKHGILFYNYVGTVYSDTDKVWKKRLMNLISDRNIRYFKKYGVVAKTEAVRSMLQKRGVEEVPVIPVGLDVTQICHADCGRRELREQMGLPREKKLLLFVGRLEAYKRPMAALELLEKLDESYMLVMIGNGSMSGELESRIRERGLQQRVIRKEQVPNVEMFRYYSAADYYVNFNTHEIFGMSILEAMYQGCIVIARKAPGPEEIIEDGRSGFLCDSDEEMVQRIAGNIPEQMPEWAKKRIVSAFTWKRSADRLEERIHLLQNHQ